MFPEDLKETQSCINAEKASAYLAGQCLVLPLRVGNDGKLGHSPSAAWLGPRNQSAGAMPQLCWSQPSLGVHRVVTFILRVRE